MINAINIKMQQPIKSVFVNSSFCFILSSYFMTLGFYVAWIGRILRISRPRRSAMCEHYGRGNVSELHQGKDLDIPAWQVVVRIRTPACCRVRNKCRHPAQRSDTNNIFVVHPFRMSQLKRTTRAFLRALRFQRLERVSLSFGRN